MCIHLFYLAGVERKNVTLKHILKVRYKLKLFMKLKPKDLIVIMFKYLIYRFWTPKYFKSTFKNMLIRGYVPWEKKKNVYFKMPPKQVKVIG